MNTTTTKTCDDCGFRWTKAEDHFTGEQRSACAAGRCPNCNGDQITTPAAQHTPGPWRYCEQPHPLEKYQPLIGYAVFGGEGTICDIFPHPYPVYVSEANARLIAAAPTMYSALQIILSWASNQNAYDITTVVARVIDALRDAGMDPKELDSAAIAMMSGRSGCIRQWY